MIRALPFAALLFLNACTGLQGRVEQYGEEGMDALESASETAVRGAIRYLCSTARVGALQAVFDEAQLKALNEQVCL